MPLVLAPLPVSAAGHALRVVSWSTWKSTQGKEKLHCSALHVAMASGTEHFPKAVANCCAPEEAGDAISVGLRS